MCDLESHGFWMHAAAFAQVHWQWKKLFATMCFFQTDRPGCTMIRPFDLVSADTKPLHPLLPCRVCMDKASASALRGGVAAAVVQAICVPAFMWMCPGWQS